VRSEIESLRINAQTPSNSKLVRNNTSLEYKKLATVKEGYRGPQNNRLSVIYGLVMAKECLSRGFLTHLVGKVEVISNCPLVAGC
jgi:hypothetical protein